MTSNSKKEPAEKRVTVMIVTITLLALLFMSGDVLAQSLTMPYEQGIEAFRDSLSGTVPFAISLVGIVGCGAMLIFGGEISGFLRTMVFIILVVAVIVQAENIVAGLGGDRTAGTGTAAVLHSPDSAILRAAG